MKNNPKNIRERKLEWIAASTMSECCDATTKCSKNDASTICLKHVELVDLLIPLDDVNEFEIENENE